MTKLQGTYSRDTSDRLCFEIFDLEAVDYPSLVSRVVKRFDLKASGRFVMGLDEMFRDYTDGEVTVGLEWDNWSGFIVVAKAPDAESLVRRIGEFCENTRGA